MRHALYAARPGPPWTLRPARLGPHPSAAPGFTHTHYPTTTTIATHTPPPRQLTGTQWTVPITDSHRTTHDDEPPWDSYQGRTTSAPRAQRDALAPSAEERVEWNPHGSFPTHAISTKTTHKKTKHTRNGTPNHSFFFPPNFLFLFFPPSPLWEHNTSSERVPSPFTPTTRTTPHQAPLGTTSRWDCDGLPFTLKAPWNYALDAKHQHAHARTPPETQWAQHTPETSRQTSGPNNLGTLHTPETSRGSAHSRELHASQ